MKVQAENMAATTEVSAEQERRIIQPILDRLVNALNNGDATLWSSAWHLEDDLAREAQKTWFEGYVLKVRPRVGRIKLLAAVAKAESVVVKCGIVLEYQDFDPVEEVYCYTLQSVAEEQEWRIVWFEKCAMPLPFQLGYLHRPFVFESRINAAGESWWQDPDFPGLARQATDPLQPALYARAISRNIRFREAHPLLESAALLTNLMAVRTAELAQQIADPDRLQVAGNLYYAAQERIAVRLVRPDRDNSWTSKYLAPWYGIDELVALKKTDIAIVGNCAPVMALYFALLRLNGFGVKEIGQFRVGNQDILLFGIAGELYLFSSDKLLKLTAQTLYYNLVVSKVFNDRWIWTGAGFSNCPETLRRKTVAFIERQLPGMKFPERELTPGPAPLPEPETDLPDLQQISDYRVLHRRIKQDVLRASASFPDSAYTWAKYAYQTLYVPFPEVYAIWSLQCPLMQDLVKQDQTREAFMAYLGSLGQDSIFPEADRIMTADQVIRHGRGDAKAQALLLYTWLKLRENRKALVILTTGGSYCGWEDGGVWRYYDTKTHQPVLEPEGKTILAFDQQGSFYPGVKAASQSPEALRDDRIGSILRRDYFA